MELKSEPRSSNDFTAPKASRQKWRGRKMENSLAICPGDQSGPEKWGIKLWAYATRTIFLAAWESRPEMTHSRSGVKNGTHKEKANTSGESTLGYQAPTLGNYMTTFHGTARVSSNSLELATTG